MALAKYRKAVVAALTVVLTGVNVIYGTNPDIQLAISVAGALGVHLVPNAQ